MNSVAKGYTVANPDPLGLYAFASTTMLFSLYNARAEGVTNSNIVIAMALTTGGLGQVIAGVWAFAQNNVLGSTAYSMYGALWLSYGLTYLPGLNIAASYHGDSAGDYPNAEGLFFAVWFIITAFHVVGTLRQPVGVFATFLFLDLSFMLLMIGALLKTVACTKVGGYMGVISGACAFYQGSAALYTPDNTPVRLPNPMMPQLEGFSLWRTVGQQTEGAKDDSGSDDETASESGKRSMTQFDPRAELPVVA